jgi:glycosyltransferase involved in cell wall biosynthesis
MNILHISVRADFGGGPEHMYQQILHQVECHNIKAFLACPNDYPYYERYSNIVGSENVVVIPHRKFNVFKLFSIVKFIRANKINAVHSHGKGAGLYGRLIRLVSGIPCVHTFHGLHVGEYSKLKKRIYIALEWFLGVFTTRVICVSHGELESIKSEGIAPANKLIQIDNGVKVPDSVRSRVLRSPLNILAVNRFDDQKNPELLIAIADAIKNSPLLGKVKILVIGDGNRFSQCQKSIDDKSLNDILTLFGPTTNPRKFMAEADAFLSTSRWEGMPLAVLEAMSEGLPVVATRVVGNVDVMQDHVEGVFYKDDDASSALLAFEKILSNEFRLKCSDAAHKTVVENFSVSKMVNETVQVYREILIK